MNIFKCFTYDQCEKCGEVRTPGTRICGVRGCWHQHEKDACKPVQCYVSEVIEWAAEWWFGLVMVMVLIVIFTLLATALVASSKREEQERAEFMAECQEERAKYECTAMWRAGESRDSTTVVPMPIYMPR